MPHRLLAELAVRGCPDLSQRHHRKLKRVRLEIAGRHHRRNHYVLRIQLAPVHVRGGVGMRVQN